MHRAIPAERGWRRAGWAVLLGACLALAGCSQSRPAAKGKSVEVIVTTPITDQVLDYQDFTGRLDADLSVDIRARVSGYVDASPFKEGDRVRKGDMLFQIDPRSYKADLDQAEANYKLALADRNLQQKNAARAQQLYSSRSIGKEEYDQITANYEKAQATVRAQEAAVNRAALYLSYTRVISPLDGRISRRNVDPGNLVKADDTVLTTIVADDSMNAYFDVDERTYLDLVGEKPSATPSDPVKNLKLPVLMRLANAEDFTHSGHVDFLDNRLNGNTGTIRMRAVFRNPRGTLKSGLFVRVRLPIGQPYSALLVTDEALQSDQGRKYVYVVRTMTRKKPDGTEVKEDVVEYRPVRIGQSVQGLRVIQAAKRDRDGKVIEGLDTGDRVIISGMQRVRPNMAVQVKVQPPPAAPGFPLGKLLKLPEKLSDASRKRPPEDASEKHR